MKVMVFGASGAVGQPLVPMLRARGDVVIGTTRVAGRGYSVLAKLGAEAVVCDALDAEAVCRVVTEHQPNAIVNQLTALGGPFNPRRYREWIAPTNRLRAEGTRNLVSAARAAGTPRLVSQSIAFAYRWEGTDLKTETDPLFDRDLGFGEAVQALQELERLTLETPELLGVVLRYGWFYGPGTGYGRDGGFAQMVHKRGYPIVGGGTGVFSFVHVEDGERDAGSARRFSRRRVQHRRRRPGADARVAAGVRRSARRPAPAPRAALARSIRRRAVRSRERRSPARSVQRASAAGARMGAPVAIVAGGFRAEPRRRSRRLKARCIDNSPQRYPRPRPLAVGARAISLRIGLRSCCRSRPRPEVWPSPSAPSARAKQSRGSRCVGALSSPNSGLPRPRSAYAVTRS